jgi:VWFA-related protein
MAARILTLVLLTAPLSLAQRTTFQAQSNLVLVPFHASRGNNYVSGLKRSDIVLLEDGRPREFTILEGPGITESRTPLELVLLFDTTSKGVGALWNVKSIYDFTNHWTEVMSQAILEKGKADVRASVYRLDYMQFERLSQPTADPKEFLSAFQRLLTPISGNGAVTLELPPNRELDPKSEPPKPWPMEAAIAILNDLAAAPDRVLRTLVVFSEGVGGTTTAPEDVADQANALGIPIYPVMINYQKLSNAGQFRRETPDAPAGPWRSERGLQWMADYGRLGKLTGGRSFAPYDMSAAEVRDILEAVKNEGLSQYVVGFAPQPGPPREHKLEIKLTSKPSPKLIGGKRKVTY